MKKKIAIINQRYGLEVNGGSELYSRQIAERLVKKYDVEVLTTCALDYMTWRNHYKVGIDKINGVNVRRFPVEHERDQSIFSALNAEMLHSPNASPEKADEWIDAMGPYTPQLIEYLKEHKDAYDVFIVVTYLYYTAVRSMPIVADKAIFIPTAHQEPYIHFKMYDAIFEMPKTYIFLTEEEKLLVQNQFDIRDKPCDVMGVGVDVPYNASEVEFKKKYRIDNYLIYVGRIDLGKDCPRLFNYFMKYKQRNPSNLKLVLMGKEEIDIPKHPDIINLGFVSDMDKFNGIKGAKVLTLPSKFESLSISVLEAMAESVPVIVNGECEVLKGHCMKSNGGLYYGNFLEFESAINYLLNNSDIHQSMSQNAKRYIDEHYRWDNIMERFDQMIEIMYNG